VPEISPQLLQLLDPERSDERCGFVMNDGSIVEVGNMHPEPTEGFIMDPTAMILQADDAAATWHTHPKTGPNLSQEDYRGFLAWPRLKHHIIGLGANGPEVRTYAIYDGVVVQL
jgi:proteasome lid subunit RPN8/RPN11